MEESVKRPPSIPVAPDIHIPDRRSYETDKHEISKVNIEVSSEFTQLDVDKDMSKKGNIGSERDKNDIS